MAIYELTLRFESPDDHAAMSLGIHLEGELKSITKQVRWLNIQTFPAIAIQRLTRVVVMRTPADGEPA